MSYARHQHSASRDPSKGPKQDDKNRHHAHYTICESVSFDSNAPRMGIFHLSQSFHIFYPWLLYSFVQSYPACRTSRVTFVLPQQTLRSQAALTKAKSFFECYQKSESIIFLKIFHSDPVFQQVVNLKLSSSTVTLRQRAKRSKKFSPVVATTHRLLAIRYSAMQYSYRSQSIACNLM
jgi:hypothetical protein